VIAPNLDYTPTEEVEALKAFDRTANHNYIKVTEEAIRRGKELGIKVYLYPLVPREDVLMCDANPVHNVWISASGEVEPCPYLALSLRGQLPKLFWGKKEDLTRFSFGNALEGLDRVLNGQTARSFREAFSRRLLADRLGTIARAKGSSMPRVSSSSIDFLESLAQMTGMEISSVLPPAPDICCKCYKLYGL
jgi:hypothetical protein